MTRAKAKAQKQYREPGEAAGVLDLRGMTYAEASKALNQRDDVHMIYEMAMFSQYCDGSVLDCQTMTTYTAERIAIGGVVPEPLGRGSKLQREIAADLKRNGKNALLHGTTKNLAPRVG